MDSEEEFVTTDVIDGFGGEYEGERNPDEERHGQGKATYTNGDTYEGEFKFGKRDGPGVYRFESNNSSYTGEYFEGKRKGYGVMIYPDGSKYEGNWLEGMKDGEGKYTYINGDTYEGKWENGVKHGVGCYKYESVGSVLKGCFKDGHPSGRGKFVFDAGCEQHGVYMMKDTVKMVDKRMVLLGSEALWTVRQLNSLTIKL